MHRLIYESAAWRITEHIDTDADFESLCGDTFSLKANPTMDPIEMAKELEAFREEVNREGVYGYELERRCGECGAWKHVDSCWGFVGMFEDNPKSRYHHYIVDELKGQING